MVLIREVITEVTIRETIIVDSPEVTAINLITEEATITVAFAREGIIPMSIPVETDPTMVIIFRLPQPVRQAMQETATQRALL